MTRRVVIEVLAPPVPPVGLDRTVAGLLTAQGAAVRDVTVVDTTSPYEWVLLVDTDAPTRDVDTVATRVGLTGTVAAVVAAV